MTRFDDVQRARWLRTNAHVYLRSDAQRFLRPDWKRFVQAAFAPVFLSQLEGKANFNPNQPRVPKGNPDGGQWTAEGGDAHTFDDDQWGEGNTDSGGGNGNGDETEDNQRGSGTRAPLRITIYPRGIGDNGGPPLDTPPERPPIIQDEEPPTTRLRNRIVKGVARWVARSALRLPLGPVGTTIVVLEAAYWLHKAYPYIQAYQDPAKHLHELQEAVSTPQNGYEVHHIVEQTPAEKDGFPRSKIDAPENLVRIPTLKHWEITSWYMTKNKDYGGLSPRNYLRDKSWEERRRVGLEALVKFGVLKP